MWTIRGLVFGAVMAVLASAGIAHAQAIGGLSAGFQEGYSRGVRAGEEDGRRGQSFNFTDESDYRSADAGYRSQYGPRDRYRNEFRRGYEQGYRSAYDRYRSSGRGRGGYDSGRYGPVPPYRPGERGAPSRRYYSRAFDSGYGDGYEAGLDDGRDGRRFDPVAERRYRSADRGYERQYGSREAYKIEYRDAFKQGYSAGYDDGRRYGSRRWWSPFER